MCDLSIVLPGIRHSRWRELYDSAIQSVGEYSFEMIIVGPGDIPENMVGISNFKFIKDYGAPARAAQIGVAEATGKYMTWGSDDGVFLPNALEAALNEISDKKRNDAVVMRYSEGGNFPDDSYWLAWTHADLRLPGVPKHYIIAPVAMYNLDYFKELGGSAPRCCYQKTRNVLCCFH